MSEISKFEGYKKKLQGCCDENNLIFKFTKDRYPMSLQIKPVSGMDGQLSMMEDAGDGGYMSPDAYLLFVYDNGDLTWRTSETFTISDTLFSKLKNFFKNMCFCWWQYFFRDLMEHGNLSAEELPQESENDMPDDAEPLEEFELDDMDTDSDDIPDADDFEEDADDDDEA